MNSSAFSPSYNAGPSGQAAQNTLFPIFLRLEQLRVLLVGGGAAGLEHLQAVLRNSPATAVTVVDGRILPELRTLAAQYPGVRLLERPYHHTDLLGHDLVLIASADAALNRQVKVDAAGQGLLAHLSDAPAESDFHLATVVQKGELKVAISTNGKAPTVAKRLGQVLSETLPAELSAVLRQLNHVGRRVEGQTELEIEARATAKWRRVATGALTAFGLLLGLSILSMYYTWPQVWQIVSHADTFYIFVAVGFGAQLVDGLLGMGYGVVTAISLMSLGQSPAAVSASIHTAEMFASGASGYQHYRFGNVNRRLFKAMLIPGVLGAVAGAWLLGRFGEDYARYVKPLLAAYLLLLGLRLIARAFSRGEQPKRRVKRVGLLAAVGGFLDSFGGGGWGPLVTSTLIAYGRTPQYVIGSVSLTEFFVTFASALTFFATIGISHWQIVLGLIVGGVAAAPFAARLAGRVSTRVMFLGVGGMVIVWSLWALRKVFLG